MFGGLWEPLATAGVVAGLMAGGLLTATAASEARIFKGSETAAVQSAPGQARAQQGTLPEPPAPPTWAWVGRVDSTEDGGFILEGPCGKWALSPSGGIEDVLEERLHQRAILIGHVATEAHRPTVQVIAVLAEHDEIPEGTKAFPKCLKHERQEQGRPEHPPVQLLGLLGRMVHQGLHDVPKDQRFEHFIGAQIALLDKDGNPVVARLIAGIAKTTTATSLTFDPNGPEGDLTVSVTPETKIVRPGNGGIEALQPGDKLLVVLLNGQAQMIVASKQVTTTIWPHMAGVFGPKGHQEEMSARPEKAQSNQKSHEGQPFDKLRANGHDARAEARDKDDKFEFLVRNRSHKEE